MENDKEKSASTTPAHESADGELLPCPIPECPGKGIKARTGRVACDEPGCVLDCEFILFDVWQSLSRQSDAVGEVTPKPTDGELFESPLEYWRNRAMKLQNELESARADKLARSAMKARPHPFVRCIHCASVLGYIGDDQEGYRVNSCSCQGTSATTEPHPDAGKAFTELNGSLAYWALQWMNHAAEEVDKAFEDMKAMVRRIQPQPAKMPAKVWVTLPGEWSEALESIRVYANEPVGEMGAWYRHHIPVHGAAEGKRLDAIERLCTAPRVLSCQHLRAENGCALPNGAECPKPDGDA